MRLLLSALAWTIVCLAVGAAVAQQPGRVYRIAWLIAGRPGVEPEPYEKWTRLGATFREALRERGFVAGRNLVVDVRSAQGDVSRLPALATELVATQPDVLVSPGTAPTVALMRATKTLPIVFPGVGTPVERGIVKSLVNHGTNATGMAVNIERLKLWQLLREVAPATRRAGFLAYGPNSLAQDRTPEYRASRLAAIGNDIAPYGVEVVDMFVDALDDIEPKAARLAGRGDAAIYVATDTTMYAWRDKVMEIALRHRLPTACSQSFDWSQAGCLITYGEDPDDMWRRAALQVVKVLNGTKPADIPIEQPTKFKLLVNARTAKTLGLTVPPAMLALADEVIE